MYLRMYLFQWLNTHQQVFDAHFSLLPSIFTITIFAAFIQHFISTTNHTMAARLIAGAMRM